MRCQLGMLTVSVGLASAIAFGCAASGAGSPRAAVTTVGERSSVPPAPRLSRAEREAREQQVDDDALKVSCDRGDFAGCRLFEAISGCQRGDVDECEFAGTAYFGAEGGRRHVRGATVYWLRACSIAPSRCTGYGLLLLAVPGSDESAHQLFDRACEVDSSQCAAVGTMFLEGRGAIRQDLGRGHTSFEQGCDAGAPAGCEALRRK